MTTAEPYDAIIIGAGQAGGPLSTALANAGWKTALVEREHVGGTCVNKGCTPTKTMVASARVAYLAQRAADYGIHIGDVRVDLKAVRQRKRDIVESFRGGSERRIEDTEGLDLLMGEARFTSAQSIEVRLNDGGARHLTAPKIFINSGARPRVPDLPGLDGVPYLDSTSVMELDKAPAHLLVIGGGYIGLEFGQMFRRFGSKVTIIQRRDQLLSREDPDVAEEVAKILREDGV
ncbi:MAG: FAD-dependent oxidoreductase, partial [Anaerolineae bacterium]